MPNGIVHNKALVMATIAAFPVIAYRAGPGEAFVGALGVASGMSLTPDLDLYENVIKYFTIDKFLKRPLFWLWVLYWLPYAKAVPHRSVWSHTPVLGTFLRLLYLFLPILVVLYMSVDTINIAILYTIIHFGYWWVLGLTTADTIHIAMDTIL